MKLALLDRDGVINVDRPDSVKSKEEFSLLPGVITAIKLLNEASIPVAIVTNQAVVGRGILSPEGLKGIHDYLEDLLKAEGAFLDRIYVCSSADPEDPRRKPNPGLLLDALTDFKVSPEEAIVVGDDLRDLQAAGAIGCSRVLVKTGKGAENLRKGLPSSVLPVHIFDDLYQAVFCLLNEQIC
ncbi:MAG: HAD family hydrolase [Alphaproteobacteria bacterium]|nr:HAD family hydrolase [Alphaproteobacteria bacterium]